MKIDALIAVLLYSDRNNTSDVIQILFRQQKNKLETGSQNIPCPIYIDAKKVAMSPPILEMAKEYITKL